MSHLFFLFFIYLDAKITGVWKIVILDDKDRPSLRTAACKIYEDYGASAHLITADESLAQHRMVC
jgi:hypothetical protein